METALAAPGSRLLLAPEAEGEAPAVATADMDPALAELVEAWPTLPKAVRAGVVAMVRAASREP